MWLGFIKVVGRNMCYCKFFSFIFFFELYVNGEICLIFCIIIVDLFVGIRFNLEYIIKYGVCY